jgi:hypothetical protein
VADFSGLIASEINSLPSELRPTFLRIFQAILTDLRIGHPTFAARDPLKNFGGAFLHGTTHATPGTEFTMAHGFERVPYLALACLPLDTVGAQMVNLTTTRAADDKRLYISSPTASASISLIVEG